MAAGAQGATCPRGRSSATPGSPRAARRRRRAPSRLTAHARCAAPGSARSAARWRRRWPSWRRRTPRWRARRTSCRRRWRRTGEACAKGSTAPRPRRPPAAEVDVSAPARRSPAAHCDLHPPWQPALPPRAGSCAPAAMSWWRPTWSACWRGAASGRRRMHSRVRAASTPTAGAASRSSWEGGAASASAYTCALTAAPGVWGTCAPKSPPTPRALLCCLLP